MTCLQNGCTPCSTLKTTKAHFPSGLPSQVARTGTMPAQHRTSVLCLASAVRDTPKDRPYVGAHMPRTPCRFYR